MMGHVTAADLGLPRTAQLRALGNGVVPQQATRAVTALLYLAHAAGQPAMAPLELREKDPPRKGAAA